jgi:hypothetical protein
MKLARTIRFDESDANVFDPAAESGEWAIPGGFAFSDLAAEDLAGKTRQAFANGWLGLDSFGRSTFVAVSDITAAERDAAVMRLAAHFVSDWGAPSLEAALPVAEEEVAYMADLCDEHRPNTLLVVERALEEAGVREAFRVIETTEATMVDVIGAEAAAHAKEKLGLD